MRIRSAGLATLIAAAGIWMSFPNEPATAAPKAAATAKSKAKPSIASAERPGAVSKVRKRADSTKRSRTAQAHHRKKAPLKASSDARARKLTGQADTAKAKSGADAVKVGLASKEFPPAVANARAQVLADDQARNLAALDSTDVPFMDGVQLAAADQLTESDRAATTNAEPVPNVDAPAANLPAPAGVGKIIRPVSSSEKPVFKTDDDTWSKTSLIGKIFIAFGSLLTLASAARLMIA